MFSFLHNTIKNVIFARGKGKSTICNSNSKYSILATTLSLAEKREVSRIIRKRQRYYLPGLSKKEILRRKRFAKSIIKKINKKASKKRPEPLPKKILSIRRKKSEFLSSFLPERDGIWKPVTKRDREIHEINLENFSILDNSKQTIESLIEIAQAETKWLGFKINFSDTTCEDITPYLILGLMRQDMAPVVSGGHITPAVTGMVDAVGLNDLLSITHIQRRHVSPTFLPFRVRYRRKTGTSTSTNIALQPSTREALTDELINTVDNWLRQLVQRELNKDGKGHLSAIVGEILNNAERHSDMLGRDGDWAIAGFLTAVVEDETTGKTKYVCCLSIISLGATIADSISKCEDEKTLEYLNQYIDKHHKTTGMSKECLASVYALQDGVSRFQQDATGDRSRGGVGMMDMVQFVGALGCLGPDDKPAEITILSGEACINIRKPHFEVVFDSVERNDRREIWFNPSNNIAVPPEPAYVYSMPVRFPGTAVAMRFCINPSSPEAEDGSKGNEKRD